MDPMTEEMPVEETDAGEAGLGAEAAIAALELAAQDPELAAALDLLEPVTLTPTEDGGFAVTCADCEAVVSADQIEEHLGINPEGEDEPS
jgi:hypothetical protein